MSDELGLIICPNPKCRRKIEEPLLLNNLFTAPEQYYACPHCLVRLVTDAEKEEVHKRKDATEKLTAGPLLHSVYHEKGYSKCGGFLGFLARLPEHTSIPRECLTCPRLADCATETRGS